GTMTLAAGSGRNFNVSALAIDSAHGAKLDIGDNKLIVRTTPIGSWNGSAYTGITGLIQSGRNGTALPLWDGGGIVTSQSQATTGNLTSIAVASAAQVKNIAATSTSVWAGQTVTGSDT